jgi:hypothetical protein
MGIFVQGMSAMACIVIVLFFLRFWRRTADRLFLIFAIAFGLMFVTRLVSAKLTIDAVTAATVSRPATSGPAPGETGSVAANEGTAGSNPVHNTSVYVIRLLAYLLIVAGIIDKNRPVARS